MRASTAALLAAAILFTACSRAPAPDETATEDGAAPEAAEQLSALFDEHFQRSLELNPLRATFIGDDRYNDRLANSIGPEHIQASLDLDKEFLERLFEIDRDALSANDRISYDLFKLQREQNIEGHRYPGVEGRAVGLPPHGGALAGVAGHEAHDGGVAVDRGP